MGWTQLDFCHVTWQTGTRSQSLKTDRAPLHCLGIFVFYGGCYDFVIAYYGLIFTRVFLSVTDEFMLPTPTTTHLLQPPPTALVPW